MASKESDRPIITVQN